MLVVPIHKIQHSFEKVFENILLNTYIGKFETGLQLLVITNIVSLTFKKIGVTLSI